MDLYQTYNKWEKEEEYYKSFLLQIKYNNFILLCQMFMGTLYYIYYYNLYCQNRIVVLYTFNKNNLIKII